MEVTQTVYQLTENEMKELKNKFFNNGIQAVRKYIFYVLSHSGRKCSVQYATEFVNDLLDFAVGKSDEIINVSHIDLQDFINGKR